MSTATRQVRMGKPRVKPEHAPYRISGGRIRIGGVSFGAAAELSDPDGWVWDMLEAMDGTRSVQEVVDRVLDGHPGVSRESAWLGAEQLIASGYVEDAGAACPPELTERDRERHDRALGYFRWIDLTPRASSWEPQLLLRRARVTVLGVGGTGGVAAMALAASGVGRLHCVDPDVVELSNLNRQVLYSEDDIGTPKAKAAVSRLRRLNSDIEVSGQWLRITGPDNIMPLARECDVLLMSADRPPEVRFWVNRACIAAGRPWVSAGYHGPLVQAGVYVPGNGACLECVRTANQAAHEADGAYPQDASGRSEAVGNAVAATSAGISGYLAAHYVTALITGAPPVTPGGVYAVNLSAVDAPFLFAPPRRAGCPECGPLG